MKEENITAGFNFAIKAVLLVPTSSCLTDVEVFSRVWSVPPDERVRVEN